MRRGRAAGAFIAVLISGALMDFARGGDLVECEPQRVTDDGRYLILTVWLGTDRRNRVYWLDLQDPRRPVLQGAIVRMLDAFDASYSWPRNASTAPQ